MACSNLTSGRETFKLTKLKRTTLLALCVAVLLIPGGTAGGAPVSDAPASADIVNFTAAAEYSRRHNGEATLVLHKGKVVFESYYNGFRRDDAHDLASGTKSFWGVAAVACEADGILRLDDCVSDTIHEWKRDAKRRRITIRQLLTMTSGLEPALTALDGPRIGDKYAYACALPCTAKPGSTFAYGASNAFVFGEVLKRKLHRDPVDYLRRRILTPAGSAIGFWRKDRAGNSSMPAGCGMTARNWALYGWLLLSGGKVNGKSIVPAQKLKLCLQGTAANPAYGLGFWLTAEDPFGAHAGQPAMFTAPTGTYMAAGAGNQRLYIIPKRNLVVVHFGKANGFRSDAFLSTLLTGKR